MELQSYLRELSEFEDIPVNVHGEYEYRFLEDYWTEPNRWPYLLKFDSKNAGFALVRRENDIFVMAEITVFIEYRGFRWGQVFAEAVFQKHPGNWIVEYDIANEIGNNFWNNLIKTIRIGNFKREKINAKRESLAFTIGESK
jgi:predicted acetyltransferase